MWVKPKNLGKKEKKMQKKYFFIQTVNEEEQKLKYKKRSYRS
jgi:hypothetical protein